MYSSDSSSSSSESGEEYSTEKKIARDSFVWVIENFSVSQLQAYKRIKSPLFHSKKKDTLKWQLEIFKSPDITSKEDSISLIFVSENIWRTEKTALCSFYVLGLDGGKKHKKVFGIKKFNKKSQITFHCYSYLKCNLLQSNVNNELLPNGNLILGCEIFYYCDLIKNAALLKNKNTKKSINLLLNDIARMLQLPMFSDCAIEVQGLQIKVHRCILAGRSEVFKSLLTEE